MALLSGIVNLDVQLVEGNARMTTEQLTELGEALCVLSEKSSVLKERDELRALMEENLHAEEVSSIWQDMWGSFLDIL